MIGSLLLALLVGYLLGRLMSAGPVAPGPLQIVNDQREKIPVVTVEGIVNGEVRGTIDGTARFFLGVVPAIPDESGVFRLPAAPFLRNTVTVIVPEGMQFVASRKGKYYYTVRSANGERIVPENRVYFRKAEEAEAAGFAQGK